MNRGAIGQASAQRHVLDIENPGGGRDSGKAAVLPRQPKADAALVRVRGLAE